MKIAAISDVHIKFPNDEADKFLMSFLNHPLVEQSDYIILLGDIFDLMCGSHNEYLSSYAHLFSKIYNLHKSGKKIFYFEGNHDVHLERLLKKLWSSNQIIVSQTPIVELIDGKKYYFSHGDEHEVNNISYLRYIKFIRSSPLKFFANFIMPYRVLNFLGERASRISRKNGSRKFDAEAVRMTFRSGVEQSTKGEYDFVLGGHSHVQDNYRLPDSSSIYLNNGYALKSKTFILIDNHYPQFINLP